MAELFSSGGKLHWMKNLYRRWKYGGGCCDVYNLDHYLAKKILPPLKEFSRQVDSYPGSYGTADQWEKDLAEMVWAFEWFLDGEGYEEQLEIQQENMKRMQNGFELFGKNFRSLWK